MTYDQHATQARQHARTYGLVDGIHYADNWRRRIDALYAEINATGLSWWIDSAIGMLPDGRMAIVGGPGAVCSIAEPVDASKPRVL